MKNPETAKRLRQALDMANLSAQELSNMSEVSKSSISQYVNGTSAPSNISAGKMAKVLKCSPVWLMGFDVPMFDNIEPYYADPETARLTQFLCDNREYKVLFDAVANVKPDDIAKALKALNIFIEE